LMTSAARALWCNSCHLARVTARDFPWLSFCLTFCLTCAQGRVAGTDPVAFESKVVELRSEFNSRLLTDAEAQKLSSHVSKLCRWLSLCLPFDRKVRGGAIAITSPSANKSRARSEADKASALGQFWATTLSETRGIRRGLRPWLEKSMFRLPPDIPGPDAERLAGVIIALSKKLSTTGPDGVPYSAWGALPREAAAALIELLARILRLADDPRAQSELPKPLLEFNDSCVVFPPKKPQLVDDGELHYSPDATRPLSVA
jgi:hypothetical protein